MNKTEQRIFLAQAVVKDLYTTDHTGISPDSVMIHILQGCGPYSLNIHRHDEMIEIGIHRIIFESLSMLQQTLRDALSQAMRVKEERKEQEEKINPVVEPRKYPTSKAAKALGELILLAGPKEARRIMRLEDKTEFIQTCIHKYLLPSSYAHALWSFEGIER